MNKRKLTPYEINFLIENGIDPFSIDYSELGEMPIEYFVEKAEFFGSKFFVNSNVLIPRIESEELVRLALKFINERKFKNLNFAEIGTGSGAIGISIAKELVFPNVNFNGYMSDISDGALSVAKTNAERITKAKYENCFTLAIGESEESNQNSLNSSLQKSKIKIIKSNLLENYPQNMKGKFDLIIANLPYIPTSRIPNLTSSVKDYEPILALDGGEDGLTIIKKLLTQSEQFLAETGLILLEVDDTHDQKTADIVVAELKIANLKIKAMKDFNDKWRYWECSMKI